MSRIEPWPLQNNHISKNKKKVDSHSSPAALGPWAKVENEAGNPRERLGQDGCLCGNQGAAGAQTGHGGDAEANLRSGPPASNESYETIEDSIPQRPQAAGPGRELWGETRSRGPTEANGCHLASTASGIGLRNQASVLGSIGNIEPREASRFGNGVLA